MADPPVIVLAYANDREDRLRYLRNLPEEARQLRAALAPAIQAHHCELVERPNATLGEIFDLFQASRYRGRIALFHYAGHADSYQLLFESAAGKPAPMNAAAFARFLAQEAGAALQLVFLNGCSTRGQVDALLDAGVAAVLATSQAIDDGKATQFAARFYAGMANGFNLGIAFGMAQAAVEAGTSSADRGVILVGSAHTESGIPPWELHVRPGAEVIRSWSLPQAAGDPLFQLPQPPAQDLPAVPFLHLHWYDRIHAQLFFGRGTEIRRLYESVTAEDGPPILLLYGQSGVGKSSLLAAGLLPRLESQFTVRYARRNPTLGLSGTLAQMFGEASTAQVVDAWHRLEADEGRPLLLVLDQAEEAYAQQEDKGNQEVADLLDLLQPLLIDKGRRPRGRLVLGFRKEWLSEIQKLMADKRLAYDEFFVRRLDRSGVIEAVTGVTKDARFQRKYGLQVEAGLPDLIADNLLEDADAAVAPTLQVLLTKMWREAKTRSHDQPTFSIALYQEMKRNGILLNDFLEQQMAQLQQQQPGLVESGLALDLLNFHTTPLGTARERTQVELATEYAHLADVLPALATALQDLYLLTDVAALRPDQAPSTRLAHDALAPLVRDRFARSTAPGQQARRILENRDAEWRDGKTGPVLDKTDLIRVGDGLPGTRALRPDEERLLTASRAHGVAQRRNRQLLGVSFGMLLALLLLIWQFDALLNVYLHNQVGRETQVVQSAGLMVDKYEVTTRFYAMCARASKCDPLQQGQTEEVNGDLPVTNVSALQAQQYCGWLGKRLPTSQEWGQIAREVYPPVGEDGYRYDPAEMNLDTNGVVSVAMLVETQANSPVGLIGNAWEWSSTVVSDSRDPEGTDNQQWDGQDSSKSLFLRGGSFQTRSRQYDLSALSATAGSDVPSPDFGIRCVNHSK
ncbi:MAG: SUMF1/EgtB/PvdO family nonheme iron enzyme [Caldilineaceae bacterium]|nr:SUMF1/EgtB/PvdO family nonheme iron enzyme [Caldilineaceae bacterium]